MCICGHGEVSLCIGDCLLILYELSPITPIWLFLVLPPQCVCVPTELSCNYIACYLPLGYPTPGGSPAQSACTLTLSLTHTHTHTHSLSLSLSIFFLQVKHRFELWRDLVSQVLKDKCMEAVGRQTQQNIVGNSSPAPSRPTLKEESVV